MGNCCRAFGLIRKYSSRLRQKKIVLLMVGLDNAGKSSTANSLCNEPVENVIPTVGFNVMKLSHRGYTVIIYDLGGGPQIRDIWSRYFADVHGIIFVVDASDSDRLDECKKVFEDLLVNEKLAGKPFLVLANKQDKAGALDELDIVDKLNIETLVNMQQCPTLVETCAAAAAPISNGRKRRLDPGIDNGYRWLLRRVISDYDALNQRVMADQEIQRVAVERERAALKKKIEERKEIEGNDKSEDEDGDNISHLSNPFQPVQVLVKEIEKKEMLQNSNAVNNELTVIKSADEVIDLECKNGENLGQSGNCTVDVVREHLRQKSAGQKKKLQMLRKNNRTAPTDDNVQLNQNCVSSPETKHTGILPPIRQRGSVAPWAHISNGKPSQHGFAWELEKSLDVVLPPPNGGKRPLSACSDSEDVVTSLR
ncbi:ADP-ribosylation factor-like protein 13B [Lycorma delicatula]|uniref:ADP-ribosylation factor-like protein 13B n=1 Tax=Lycorma delicatula TaxID=130591 RepID=UPI003F50FAC9